MQTFATPCAIFGTMISDSDKEQIMARLKHVKAALPLKVLRTGDERSGAIEEFCNEIDQLGPGITCLVAESDTAEIPSIELAPNIHYAGVPSANEMAPFMAILAASIAPTQPPAETIDRLDDIRLPATVDIYVAPFCPHCPGVVLQLFPLALANSRIDLNIIDVEMFPDRAAAVNIRSVPTLVVDGVFRSVGRVEVAEVLDYLHNRRPSALGAAAMASMLKEGDASKLSRMMASENEVFPALLKVLTHSKWPVRLGAMVVLEELAALKPVLADDALDTLWARFDHVSDQIKGDILYIMGEIGGSKSFERIASIKGSRYDAEVCEAATDALQALKDRQKNSHQ
jgi:glutaredoxin